jgi:hypothetical protein
MAPTNMGGLASRPPDPILLFQPGEVPGQALELGPPLPGGLARSVPNNSCLRSWTLPWKYGAGSCNWAADARGRRIPFQPEHTFRIPGIGGRIQVTHGQPGRATAIPPETTSACRSDARWRSQLARGGRFGRSMQCQGPRWLDCQPTCAAGFLDPILAGPARIANRNPCNRCSGVRRPGPAGAARGSGETGARPLCGPGAGPGRAVAIAVAHSFAPRWQAGRWRPRQADLLGVVGANQVEVEPGCPAGPDRACGAAGWLDQGWE